MKEPKLSKDEQELLDALESGEYESILTDARRKELEAAASNTFKKEKRINIRISNRDLTAIQSKAVEEAGLSHQKFLTGGNKSGFILVFTEGRTRDGKGHSGRI